MGDIPICLVGKFSCQVTSIFYIPRVVSICNFSGHVVCKEWIGDVYVVLLFSRTPYCVDKPQIMYFLKKLKISR